ncbi:5-methylaminomethyl-2-thiouridine methyltransferase [Caballeronia temeraria]|uniref:5-methylaminomethyl-2-thiouridine methyltransferase n=1 Tax=Caballeronia temeraria TaxID=1777137 RepID=A0A158DGG3_9BURK|nr:5-methylaminomethyl-2-thiouridine methyltransferase [Caballeronia temeraria]
MAREDATFATFTGAGMVKRALVEHGFDYRKVTGFGGKRAMLVGRRAELLSVTAS